MRKPPVVQPTDEVTTWGKVFGTPIVVKGFTWLPVVQVVVWGIIAWFAGRHHPERSRKERMGVSALTTAIILGSEWCHNIAHAGMSRLIGKPMDALRITWGMPLVVYYDIDDRDVTPRQHIMRALGGPVFNALLIPFALLFRRRTRAESVARDVADAAVGANAFLCSVSLLPIPGIDGGSILKWALVDQGRTLAEADRRVRKVNGVSGVLLELLGMAAFKRRRRFLGVLSMLLGVLSLGTALGVIKEQ
jgi:Zn-dependent protease